MDLNGNIEPIRREFPILKYKTYLNSAAHGPALGRVRAAVNDYWQFRMNECMDVESPDLKEEAAELLHVDTEELTWCTRVTQGFNMIRSMLEFDSGDNIVATELGYPSNVFVWLPLREKGVEIRRVPGKKGYLEVGDFEDLIDDNTRVVSISEIEWTTGQRYDMKAICDIAHDHGALVINDAYQAVGAIDVDAREQDVDFLLVGSGKWLCCPTSAGLFYIRGDHIDEFEPSYRFYACVEEAFRDEPPWIDPEHDNISAYEGPLGPAADKFYRGCVAESAIWGFEAALSFFNEIGKDKIERRVRSLSGYLIDGLKDLGVTVNTPIEAYERGGLVTYNTGSHELNVKSHRELQKKSIITALRYQRNIGGITVSTHLFNKKEEIDKLLELQEGLLGE
ncbi:MAG: aminotransferase class V-fold PLP-dependent enzyme [Candidatus Bathyarchaeia archaeon]